MEYKGFNYQPGNIYNFECLQAQADSASSAVVIPTVVPEYNAEEYNNYEEYWSYESFCDWLVVTLEVAGLSPDCAGLALSCLEHQDDLAAYLYTTGIDRSIVEDLVGQIYSQYSAINYAENSNDAQELYDETSAVAEEPIDEEDGEWDMMVEDVVDDEGFNFLEKALALDELIASKIDSGSLSPSSANFSADATWQALCIHSGDITLSYRSLESALQKLNDCRPCRHRLQGSCLRSDCKFDHSLADVPCRFWLLTGTGCTLEECPFSHHISVVSDGSTRFSNDAIGSADMNADSEQFPQLGAKDRSDSISYATKTSTGIKSTSVSYREVAASASLNPQPQLKNTYSSASAPKKVRSSCSETFGINDWVESGENLYSVIPFLLIFAKWNFIDARPNHARDISDISGGCSPKRCSSEQTVRGSHKGLHEV